MLNLLAAITKGTVVMIHGAGGGGWEYDIWKPVFQRAGYSVIARDLNLIDNDYAATQFDDYLDQVISWTPKQGRLIYISASMGGILALKANERRQPNAVILVDCVVPAEVGNRTSQKPNLPIVRWANGPLKDTEDAMPDSDRKTILSAWHQWRDESGTVINQILAGIPVEKPKCRVLAILAEADTDIPHATGLALAKWAGADVKSYPKMSHVGPLVSRKAKQVARFAADWIDKDH
jgi:pimeloyl-ACP methyl ester carboxylesterase